MGKPSILFAVVLSTASLLIQQVAGQASCLSDPTLDEQFPSTEGNCCMNDVCGLPCPEEVSPPAPGTYQAPTLEHFAQRHEVRKR